MSSAILSCALSKFEAVNDLKHSTSKPSNGKDTKSRVGKDIVDQILM